MTGRLIGVGLGPGDPELVTRRAWQRVSEARVIAYPVLESGDSFARRIVAEAIAPDAREIAITVPMTVARAPAQAAYDAGAAEIAAALDAGQDVVLLCEGDPLFYGSFMYLMARLEDRFEVEVVPGVTSITACAAALRRPLAARTDTLTILPGTLPEAELEARIASADAVAVMKLGRHMPKVRRVIDRLGLTAKAGYVERATLPEGRACALSDAPDTAPYFSMILLTKGADPWLN
ncbi:precorrin-2 C(20)-methyltransferase [Oceanomicrobium pacificus]|uniref:Precorrin-2 C(20)-methyltransferase n=1 Tax=Oceanomicrobium pacificus TaxID=2692916 RepID=A0A6B0TI48_9RHOB|nr:precorrin-2 C(20)-methyltransferase [Oceanomicrobium pacificus]MXU64037.1 precorrin-2 C(20)-methyltransferase [Oceanomicrobium pacificus]